MELGGGRRGVIQDVMHIDFNSYFASVEQQANPRLRGKAVGVTGGPARNALACEAGGDRPKRTVLAAASVEAKRYGVKTGMQLWEACKLCPEIIIIPGDSDKYLSVTTKFLNILKDYSPYLEVFSIDECFLQLYENRGSDVRGDSEEGVPARSRSERSRTRMLGPLRRRGRKPSWQDPEQVGREIKSRIRTEIGEYITCSIGISYNKLLAKLAGSLQKPDGLVVIPDQETAIKVLDKIELDEICGIGPRIKHKLNEMGIFNFKQLRQVPLEILTFHFKSYGHFLYNAARGIDHSQLALFYEKEEVKSIGQRFTIDHDTKDPGEIRQILLKLCESVAVRLRSKNLLGKTIHSWYREALNSHPRGEKMQLHPGGEFHGDGMQVTIQSNNDGLEIFYAAWGIFQKIWGCGSIRMIGISVSNLKPVTPANLSLLPEVQTKEIINKTLDFVNQKFGENTLQRAILLGSTGIHRKPNSYLADRRFKL